MSDLYRMLTELSPQVVFIAGPDGALRYCNNWGLAFLGRSLEDLQTNGWLECVHPDYRNELLRGLPENQKAHTSYEREIPLRSAAGTYRWVTLRSRSIQEADGSISAWIGVALDIDDRKRAEEQLQRLYRAGEALGRAQGLAETQQAIVSGARLVLGAERVILRLAEPEGLRLDTQPHTDDPAVRGDGMVIPRNADHPAAVALRERRIVAVHTQDEKQATYADMAPLPWNDDTQAGIYIPLIREEAVIGVISLFYTHPPAFAVADHSLAMNLAERCATALEQARLFEALRRSEERHRQLADAMPQLVWTSTPAGVLTYYNSRAAAYQGISQKGSNAWQDQLLLHPDDVAATRVAWEAALAARRPYDCEHRLHMADGSYRWHLSRALPAFDEHGRLSGWFGTATDIHDRKQNESDARFLVDLAELIRDSQDPEKLLADAAIRLGTYLQLDRCYFAEIDEVAGYWHIRSDYHLGLPSLAGNYVIAHYPPAIFQWMRADLTVVVDDISANRYAEAEYQASFASLGRAYVGLPLHRDRQLVAALGALMVVPHTWQERELNLLRVAGERIWLASEKLRLDAALRERNTMLNAILEGTSEPIYIKNDVGQIILANPALERILGMSSAELIGKREYDYVQDRDEAEAIMANDRQIMERGEAIIFEESALTAIGRRVYRSNKFPLRDHHGTVIGLIGISSDITGQKEAESQIARLLEEQQRLYAQEQQARLQAEAASRLKDEFLATISHELRTPLTAFLGYGQMLLSRKRDEAYIMRTVEKMVRSARVQAQLIEDLLDVSRIVTGKLQLNTEPLDLGLIIRRAIDSVRPAIAAKGLTLHTEFATDRGLVLGDPNRLQQVVWNLLSNAAKFTPEGGQMTVQLTDVAGSAQIVISDTGQGISAAFMPYLFDRFRQADSASNRQHGGLGLGLAIVRQLVEMHGGTIHAQSAGVDKGATFTIRLPLYNTMYISDHVYEPPTPVAADLLSGLRILIVDDQPAITDLLHEILAPTGAELRICHRALEALDLLDRWMPDLMISDIAMPERDGYWLVEQVRSRPPARGGLLPAIALTAYVRIEDRTRVLAAGFQMYVPKPVDPDELVMVVASLMQSQERGTES